MEGETNESSNSSSSSNEGPSDDRKSGGGKMLSTSDGAGCKSTKKYLHDKESDEYKKRRERNNVAVRKSRDKSRQKAQETMDRVDELKKDNAHLEQKVTILSKELSLLKDLFLAHAEELPDPSTTFGLYNSNLACSLGVPGDSNGEGMGSGGSAHDEENVEEEEDGENDQENDARLVYTDHEYAAAARNRAAAVNQQQGVKTVA